MRRLYLLVLSIMAAGALAQDGAIVKTFTFVPPTEYESGAALPAGAILRYVLTCSPMPAGLEQSVPGTATEFQRTFPPGTYTCTLQARATAEAGGEISEPSNAVNFTVPALVRGKARPPTTFSVR